MEKRVLIAVLLSIAVMYGYSYLVTSPPRSKTTQASAVGLPPFRRVAFEPRLARVREPRRHILRGCNP